MDYTAEEKAMLARVAAQVDRFASKPVYYIEYSNQGCLYDIRINDVYTETIWTAANTGSTVTTINSEILKSGNHRVSVRLRPFPGKTLIKGDHPFSLRIGYKDFAQQPPQDEERPWHWVWEMPEISMPEEGLPFYEFEGEFHAQVPYEITGWSDCVDLRKIPDIEKRVVDEFKKMRGWMVDKKYEQVRKYMLPKDLELMVPFYHRVKDVEWSWMEDAASIQNTEREEWQKIEDYELVFYAEGRLVTLESRKEDGYHSALLYFRERDIPDNPDMVNFTSKTFDFRLGIRKGTNELVLIR